MSKKRIAVYRPNSDGLEILNDSDLSSLKLRLKERLDTDFEITSIPYEELSDSLRTGTYEGQNIDAYLIDVDKKQPDPDNGLYVLGHQLSLEQRTVVALSLDADAPDLIREQNIPFVPVVEKSRLVYVNSVVRGLEQAMGYGTETIKRELGHAPQTDQAAPGVKEA